MSKRNELKVALADRAWWEDLGDYYGFGRLSGWTYRHSALFVLGDHSISIGGALLGALLEHRSAAVAQAKGEGR